MISILYLIFLFDINAAANISNCSKSNTHFEKIIGIRPPFNNANNQELLLHKLANNETIKPITLECLTKCQSNNDCQSFILQYDRLACYIVNHKFTASEESKLVLDNDAVWFIKICYEMQKPCNKSWIFERIPGATLIGHDTKILDQNLTRLECQQKCLDEKSFFCKSTKFKINSYLEKHDDTKGQCILSNVDRHLMPNSYRVSTYDEEYFESQCSISLDRNDSDADSQKYCAYEEYENISLAHSDLMFENSTKEQCENLCHSSTSFNCRSFSAIEGNICVLHSEDSKLLGPKLLRSYNGSTYYEKAPCLHINVSCSEDYMTIRYQPEIIFNGKLYMQSYSENPQCYVTGQGKMDLITLMLPLKTRQCGIIPVGSNTNRTLLSGTLIIQYNSFIQTQSDRIIKVGCIYGNENKILIGTGVKITSSLPNRGSTLLNISANETAAPIVEMKIVDFRSQKETSDTQIGQELELIIELKEKTDTYDIWASHLIAMTEKGDESIFLLDDRGCPTNLNIFPPLQKNVFNNTSRLTSTFQAFKFASSTLVKFSVIVQFCLKECLPIKCDNNVISHGRKRREIKSHLLETINGNTLVNVNSPNNKSSKDPTSVVNQMPLEYVMLVRNANSNPDRLILGENRILVAGYDYTTNEICMNYSLVIGLIITWIIIQIIFVVCCVVVIKRYKTYYKEAYTSASLEELHKNFGIGFSNLENKRVHWAENSDNFM